MHQSRVITEPVTSWYGSIRNSMTCVIIVAAAPSSARLTPAAVHARFGHPIYLDCRGSRGTKPPPRVTWFKNGTAVNASDRLQFDNARSVNFTCMVVCLSVYLKNRCSYDHQTYAEIFHDESWKCIHFGIKRSKVKIISHKNVALLWVLASFLS